MKGMVSTSDIRKIVDFWKNLEKEAYKKEEVHGNTKN